MANVGEGKKDEEYCARLYAARRRLSTYNDVPTGLSRHKNVPAVQRALRAIDRNPAASSPRRWLEPFSLLGSSNDAAFRNTVGIRRIRPLRESENGFSRLCPADRARLAQTDRPCQDLCAHGCRDGRPHMNGVRLRACARRRARLPNLLLPTAART